MAGLQVYKCSVVLNVPDDSITGKADDENGLLSQLGCPLSTSIAFLFIGCRIVRFLTWMLRAPSYSKQDGTCIAIFYLDLKVALSVTSEFYWLVIRQNSIQIQGERSQIPLFSQVKKFVTFCL